MSSSLLRPATRPSGRAWSVKDAAEFAALRDFRLLQLLSTDRRALTTARLLGVPFGVGKVQHAAAPPPPGGPPPVADATGGSANSPVKRRPRKLSEARRQKLEARPRAQAHRQRRMHMKFLQVIPLVSAYVARTRSASATADAVMSPADGTVDAAAMPSPAFVR